MTINELAEIIREAQERGKGNALAVVLINDDAENNADDCAYGAAHRADGEEVFIIDCIKDKYKQLREAPPAPKTQILGMSCAPISESPWQ